MTADEFMRSILWDRTQRWTANLGEWLRAVLVLLVLLVALRAIL